MTIKDKVPMGRAELRQRVSQLEEEVNELKRKLDRQTAEIECMLSEQNLVMAQMMLEFIEAAKRQDELGETRE